MKNIIIFLTLVFCDRISKWLALTYVQYETVPVLPCLDFSLSWNRGITWGVFGGSSEMGFYLLTSLIGAIILIFAAYTFMQYYQNEPILFELFVLSGATSNFFDRIYYGAVVDFIDFYVGNWHWPTFNIADACIVIGVGGIIIKGLLCSFQKT